MTLSVSMRQEGKMLIECPKCGEADKRAIGMNKCGLCECEFFVASNGSAYAPAKRERAQPIHGQHMDEPRKCPVCGETDPYPAWFCMMRATGNAEQGKPCSYSREGNDRMKDRFAERVHT